MKVSIEIDCTPNEARQFFGLPNVERVQEILMEKVGQRMAEAVERFAPDQLMSNWLSMFPQDTDWFQKVFTDAMARAKSPDR
jgi:Family of unknown function (DUF6489)